MREKKRSRPEMRPVMLGTAVVLALFLAGLLYLGVATWLQYKNSIIDKQKEQMLLTTQAISENLEQYIQEAQADLESLSLAAEKPDDPDLAAGAREQLKTYADSHEGAVYDVAVLGEDGQITFRIRDSQVAQVFGSTNQEGQQVAQVQMEDKTLCLMLGPRFPQRINTEFAHVLDEHTVEMRVWERGSSETLACGTGACAVAVASILNGLTKRSVTVKLLGGDLMIEWNEENGHVFMTGPAEVVFDGEIDLSGIVK